MKYLFLLGLISLCSCSQKADFQVGECTLGPDGFISKITKIEKENYLVQNRINETWAAEIATPFRSLNKSKGFVTVNCP